MSNNESTSCDTTIAITCKFNGNSYLKNCVWIKYEIAQIEIDIMHVNALTRSCIN